MNGSGSHFQIHAIQRRDWSAREAFC